MTDDTQIVQSLGPAKAQADVGRADPDQVQDQADQIGHGQVATGCDGQCGLSFEWIAIWNKHADLTAKTAVAADTRGDEALHIRSSHGAICINLGVISIIKSIVRDHSPG
ncbi:hypothetical protein [Sphingobium yanoikuyae]|uniref:hypothetical protein n=1 Tax=Sphingobium yanoikuyae TaxID=13690 RepID=UPI0026ECDA07|nr:hypothetical protein [Sphingobium yanoikuyae]